MRRLSCSLWFVLACAPSTRPAAVSPAGSVSAAPEQTTTLHDTMRDHFSDATAARNGVIEGRMESVQAALQRLSTSKEGDDTPEDWRAWLAEMHAAAERGAHAASLAEAAVTVAALGANCGECHRATRGGMRRGAHPSGYEPPGYAPQEQPDQRDQQALQEKMARHKFSADALWLGLTGPSHPDWTQGAAALMNIQVPALVTLHGDPATTDRRASGQGTLQGTSEYTEPQPSPDTSANLAQPARPAVDLSAALVELRELGQQADQAKTAADKQAVFAKIILRCGACHTELGVRSY
jgi:hypothetical protein